jgi:NitT/TauT family transport system permease protein
VTDRALTDEFSSIHSGLQRNGRPRAFGLLTAAAAWLAAAAVTLLWPDWKPHPLTEALGTVQALAAAPLILAFVLGPRLGAVGRWLDKASAWLVVAPLLLTFWQIAAGKTTYWPQPYFPAPQAVIDVYFADAARLAASIKGSLVLLSAGFGLGASLGFVTGLAAGWSASAGYWIGPVLRLVGPLPATALVPLALFLFPTTFSAGVFLVALATWFPVAVLTSSGVASVESAYYDVARTLGADQRFLLLRIAIPGCLPHVFVGLFMGLGHALAVLVVAEMLGVKDGLGYYIEWARGWGAYGNLYAGLLIMMILFSSLTSALFAVRDRLLPWRKDVVEW